VRNGRRPALAEGFCMLQVRVGACQKLAKILVAQACAGLNGRNRNSEPETMECEKSRELQKRSGHSGVPAKGVKKVVAGMSAVSVRVT
jgi:hypothetical protein